MILQDSDTNKSWWKAPRALIFNRYLKTAGGGERSSFEYARALEDLGFEITFITDPNSNINLSKLCSMFGIYPKTTWKIIELPPEEVSSYCRRNSISVFVNHTFANYLPSPVPCGIYALMFPHIVSEEFLSAMGTYRAIDCNSPFTELHGKLRWGDRLPFSVVPPPISEEHFRFADVSTKKSKLVLNVGRFNVDGHSKFQKDAIISFKKLVDDGVLDKEWRMVVVGQLNEGEKNRAYFNECVNLASDQIIVKQNIPFRELVSYYQQAAVLFQFTGFGIDYGISPERCEHLGLVSLDALCYGALPVVFDRSGIGMLIRWGETGYTFNSYDELARCMSYVARDFGTPYHHIQIQKCKDEAIKYSFKSFRKKVKRSLVA